MQALSAAIGAALLFGIEAAVGVAALGGIFFLDLPSLLVAFVWLGVAVGLGVGVVVGLFIFRRERQFGALDATAPEPVEPGGAVGGRPA